MNSLCISSGLNMPYSVIMPLISSLGVTSNPGFITLTSLGQINLLFIMVTSSLSLNSITISSPVLISASIVDFGAAI